jgi:hypothetical protein
VTTLRRCRSRSRRAPDLFAQVSPDSSPDSSIILTTRASSQVTPGQSLVLICFFRRFTTFRHPDFLFPDRRSTHDPRRKKPKPSSRKFLHRPRVPCGGIGNSTYGRLHTVVCLPSGESLFLSRARTSHITQPAQLFRPGDTDGLSGAYATRRRTLAPRKSETTPGLDRRHQPTQLALSLAKVPDR